LPAPIKTSPGSRAECGTRLMVPRVVKKTCGAALGGYHLRRLSQPTRKGCTGQASTFILWSARCGCCYFWHMRGRRPAVSPRPRPRRAPCLVNCTASQISGVARSRAVILRCPRASITITSPATQTARGPRRMRPGSGLSPLQSSARKDAHRAPQGDGLSLSLYDAVQLTKLPA
jgi:hypothetical protein